MWIGDTLHGPAVGGKKSYLFAFIDDHSRAVMGARWSHHDDVVRMAAGFRPALQARGVPRACASDNGSPFAGAGLLRGCGVLGVKLVHSRPGKPEGRGKIERFFRTVRDQFLVEAGDGEKVAGLAEMNRLFRAWLETAYHQAVHSETGEAPGRPVGEGHPGRAGRSRAGPAAGGVPVVRAAQGRQDRPGPAARQRLPGRRVAGRAGSGAAVRPVRPGPDRGPPGGKPAGTAVPAVPTIAQDNYSGGRFQSPWAQAASVSCGCSLASSCFTASAGVARCTPDRPRETRQATSGSLWLTGASPPRRTQTS